MWEATCAAKVKEAPGVDFAYPGCPFQVSISDSIAGVPLPDPLLRLKHKHDAARGRTDSNLRAHAHVCLYKHAKMGGHDPYLLLLAYLHHDHLTMEQHVATLRETEQGRHELVHLTSAPLDIWFRRDDGGDMRLRTMKLVVGPRRAREFWAVLGDPRDSARWLAARLLPRLRPAAIRLHKDQIQVWIALFE